MYIGADRSAPELMQTLYTNYPAKAGLLRNKLLIIKLSLPKTLPPEINADPLASVCNNVIHAGVHGELILTLLRQIDIALGSECSNGSYSLWFGV